jgi:hypothetical protein
LWVGAGAAVFLATIVYFLVSALLMPDAPSTFGQPQIQMHHIVGQGERGNQLGWRFAADSSDISTDGSVTTYHHVRRGTYYLKGKPAYMLTANEVTLDMRSQNYTGTGAVHVWSVRPRDISDLKTDHVQWSNPLQILTCTGQVRVKYKGYDMVTSRLQANFLTGDSSLGATSIQSGG